MKHRTIAALAQEGGVGIETVRFYQRRGLMQTPDRYDGSGRSGGIRRYGDEDVRRLQFIKSAQTAGFTLDQIGELLSLDASEDRARAHVLATERLAALDVTIAEMQRARGSLTRLVRACGSSSAGPCPIIAAFQGKHPYIAEAS